MKSYSDDSFPVGCESLSDVFFPKFWRFPVPLFLPESGDKTIFRNVENYAPTDPALHPRRIEF